MLRTTRGFQKLSVEQDAILLGCFFSLQEMASLIGKGRANVEAELLA
jgi:hypothetical protein